MGVTYRFWKGAWWVFVHAKGKRKGKRIGADKETAQKVAKALSEALALDNLGLPTAATSKVQPTLRVYAAEWLKTVSGVLKASSVGFYSGHLDQHVLPALGHRLVATLTRPDCRTLITACRVTKGLKVATVKGIVRTLSTVLTQAVEDGLLPANPAHRMGRYLRQGDEPKHQIVPLTRAEVQLVLTVAKQSFPELYPLLFCAVRTGMRQGELLALKWTDIDFAGGFIEVHRNLVRGVVTTPKNHQRRRVDMSQQLAIELGASSRRQTEEALAVGLDRPPFAFPSDDRTMLDESNVRKAFARVLRKAKMRHVRFHDLRHTFASLLLQHGESLAYVRDQLGHKSIQITCDVYGHLVPGGNRKAVDRLDDDVKVDGTDGTPAAPEGSDVEQENGVTPLESVVSQEGLEPSTRRLRVLSKRPKVAVS